MNRQDFQELAEARVAEAQALLEAGLPSGAYYLAGYAVECALKACIAKGTQQYDFPDRKTVNASYTHNLDDLIKVAELGDDLQSAMRGSPEIQVNWGIVKEWSEGSRYLTWTTNEAVGLIEAINDDRHGILTWLRLRW